MSQADDNRAATAATPQPSPPASEPPKACQGCSGLLPRPALHVDLEDMDRFVMEKLFRKASIAQQMLTDLLQQLTKLQASHANC